MKSERAPRWLADFQARFGATLRTPLDRSTGTLRATPTRYDDRLCATVLAGPSLPARERIAVYNRQYWFRLFGVLQDEFPLTARLLGYWSFNEYACRFLLARPPRHRDIAKVADGFVEFLATTLQHPITGRGVPRVLPPTEALLQAAHIDAAWREVFWAPDEKAWVPEPEDAARLEHARLVPRRSWVLVTESWRLTELRMRVNNVRGEKPIPLPPRLRAPRTWLILRTLHGQGQVPLAPHHASLLMLLRERPLSDSLARLERDSSAADRATLPGAVRGWLAQSMELGLWTGLLPGAAARNEKKKRVSTRPAPSELGQIHGTIHGTVLSVNAPQSERRGAGGRRP